MSFNDRFCKLDPSVYGGASVLVCVFEIWCVHLILSCFAWWSWARTRQLSAPLSSCLINHSMSRTSNNRLRQCLTGYTHTGFCKNVDDGGRLCFVHGSW